MSWSRANTSCLGSLIFFAPMPLNLLITAEVLSWVITRCGRIDTKSPVRNGRSGPSARWLCAIFSVMVCGMSHLVCRTAADVRFHQSHQLADRINVLQIPDRVFQFLLRFGRPHPFGQR